MTTIDDGNISRCFPFNLYATEVRNLWWAIVHCMILASENCCWIIHHYHTITGSRYSIADPLRNVFSNTDLWFVTSIQKYQLNSNHKRTFEPLSFHRFSHKRKTASGVQFPISFGKFWCFLIHFCCDCSTTLSFLLFAFCLGNLSSPDCTLRSIWCHLCQFL